MQHRHCAASTYLNPVARQITGLEMREVENHPIEVLHALPYAVAGGAQASALLHRGSGELLEMDESASLANPLMAMCWGLWQCCVMSRWGSP
jgi:hypothetical protein